jgi:hypothetical protein
MGIDVFRTTYIVLESPTIVRVWVIDVFRTAFIVCPRFTTNSQGIGGNQCFQDGLFWLKVAKIILLLISTLSKKLKVGQKL